jgi:uncharacterized integral membrane protein (TIGR00698 family)
VPGNWQVPAAGRAADGDLVTLAPPSPADPDALLTAAPAVGDTIDARPLEAGTRLDGARALAPGLAVAAAAVAGAWAAHQLVAPLSVLTAAIVLGVLAANVRLLPEASRPGLRFASRQLMRAGIALLGLKLAFGDLLALGWRTLAVVITVVGVTFVGTQWLGRRLGLPGDQPLLIATGFSICGASAIAAMNSVTASDEDDVVASVALVTLCGTLAMALLPVLHEPLGLGDVAFGRWVGASVHDVGQVVAAAHTSGPTALGQAVVVKLMRVALLAPLVAAAAMARRRGPRPERPGSAKVGSEAAPGSGRRTPPLLPPFVACFLALAAVRSTGWLPAPVIEHALRVDELLMAAGLFGLGTMVDVRRIARTGIRVIGLGLASWLLIAGVSYAGVVLTT